MMPYWSARLLALRPQFQNNLDLQSTQTNGLYPATEGPMSSMLGTLEVQGYRRLMDPYCLVPLPHLDILLA